MFHPYAKYFAAPSTNQLGIEENEAFPNLFVNPLFPFNKSLIITFNNLYSRFCMN